MNSEQFDAIVKAIVQELQSASSSQPAIEAVAPIQPESIQFLPDPTPNQEEPASIPLTRENESLVVDLPDLTSAEFRSQPGVKSPVDDEGLRALMAATPARIGYGRSGPRYQTRHWLLFQADQAITQDTLFRSVDDDLLTKLGIFKVQTCITEGKQEYLQRPDLGRKLNDEAKQQILARCVQKPQIQVCIGDGLSAQAIESNLPQILPVLRQGCQTAGLSLGTPFFIEYCRVGVMNDIGDLIHPDILMLLIGERPGLGRADSMSIYMAYQPKSGHTDAERDVICNVFNGGTNPLEAGAYAIQLAQKMLQFQAAGVKLKLSER